MDVLQQVNQILRNKSQNSKGFKVLLIIGLVILGIWLSIKFLHKLAPKINSRYVRDMYIPKYPRSF